MYNLSPLVVRERKAGKMYFIHFCIFHTSSIELKLNMGHIWGNSEGVGKIPKMQSGKPQEQAPAVGDNKEPQQVLDLRKGLLSQFSSTHIYRMPPHHGVIRSCPQGVHCPLRA